MLFRLLPWEYAVRNLFRRPLRTSLTLVGLTTVIVLVLTVVGFLRGLEQSLRVSGDSDTVIISSRGMGSVSENQGATMVEDDFQLICFDFVSEPSTPGAFMMKEAKHLRESNIFTKA